MHLRASRAAVAVDLHKVESATEAGRITPETFIFGKNSKTLQTA
jgi:hypothetical protein